LTAQQSKQKRILNTKINYNSGIMVDWGFLLPFLDDNIRHFGAYALSSRNQSVSQPVSAAKFNAAGAQPTLHSSTHESLYSPYLIA